MATKGESQENDRILSKALSEGVLFTDEQGRLTYVDSALEEMFGIPSAVSLGTHFRDYISSASVENAETAFLGCAQGRIIQDVQLQAVHHDGHVFLIEITVRPLSATASFRALSRSYGRSPNGGGRKRPCGRASSGFGPYWRTPSISPIGGI